MRSIFAPFALAGAILAASLVGTASAPAAAQSSLTSAGYQLLQATRQRDGDKATNLLRDGSGTLVNTRDANSGETPLAIATARRDLSWMRFFLARRADANIGTRDGTTPLMTATLLGFADGATLLLGQGARINQVNNRGESALHIAVQRGDPAMVRLLMGAGADPRLQDRVAGLSPLEYAQRDPRLAGVVTLMTARPAQRSTAPVQGPR